MSAWAKDVNDGAHRVGFSQRRRLQRWRRFQQRLAAVLGFLLLAGLLNYGCAPSADQLWKDAQANLKRREFQTALSQADVGLRRYPSEDSAWHWRFRVLKAESLERLGSREEALKLLEAEPPTSLAKSDVAIRRKYTQGIVGAWLRQGTEARQRLSEAEALAKENHPELMCEVLVRIGAVDYLRGDWAGAETAYRDALQSARAQSDRYVEATALAGLAATATKQERYDESTDWSEPALRLARSLGIKGSLGFILGNMAWNYRKLGDFDTALAVYEQAGVASAEAGLPQQQIYWLTGTARVYYEQHNYQAAETVLTQALAVARSQRNDRTLVQCLNDLAEVEIESGRIEAGRKYHKEAAQLEEASLDRSEQLASELVGARLDAAIPDYSEAEKSFRMVAQDQKADLSQRWEAEARLARIYADTGRLTQAQTEFRRAVALIEAARSSVQPENLRLSFLSTTIGFYDDYIDFLFSQRRTDEALRVAELSRARTLVEGLGNSPKTAKILANDVQPNQLARRLNAVLLFYWLGQRHSYLWVITSEKTTPFTLPAASQIDAVAKSYREVLLRSASPLDAVNPDGQKLYSVLVEPAKKLIPTGMRVILLPDGSLFELDFETFIVPEPKPHYWIEDVTLTTASSLTVLASAPASTPPKNRTLFLVGDTIPPNSNFAPLPQAAMEMKDVEKYFPEPHRTVLTGGQATPAAYFSGEPERFAYLHFVTHGIASRAQPLESAVVLSREKDEDSFKLYAHDIVKRRLSAYLVTISACNTSGTRTFSGEGLVGLSWAFLRAGAHNVIGALWEVSDNSTPELMDKLYEGLSTGEDAATALRAAKLSLLHSDSVYRKPFYWAPFQLYAGS